MISGIFEESRDVPILYFLAVIMFKSERIILLNYPQERSN